MPVTPPKSVVPAPHACHGRFLVIQLDFDCSHVSLMNLWFENHHWQAVCSFGYMQHDLAMRRMLRRRTPIETIIGNLESGCRMFRNHSKAWREIGSTRFCPEPCTTRNLLRRLVFCRHSLADNGPGLDGERPKHVETGVSMEDVNRLRARKRRRIGRDSLGTVFRDD